MKLSYLKYFIILCFSVIIKNSIAQEDGGKKLRNKRKNPITKTRISVSPVISIYKPNKHHTSNTSQKKAFCFSIKEEIRLTPENKDFLFVGIEYMLHGLNFNSYYFYDDSLKLYNTNMNYNYKLILHEVDFPIQLKHSFQKETNAIFTSYVYAGYCYRWMIKNNLIVENNGTELINKSENIIFKSPAFNPINSSFLSVGIGFQKNMPLHYRAIFAELQFKYGLSPFYFHENFTPNNLYISSHFLNFTIGYKL